ncbi:MAG: P1 family peptidase [Dehalococcoidia bacterium]|nr:P1 family peptidase [Dehalococcoidia bacterium]
MPDLRDAITDIPGIRVGQWADRRAATGCTVVLCPPGTVGGVDVRGAAPGTRETELLRPGNLVEEVHAIVLSGGSAFGLEAATGVMRFLSERGVGFKMGELCVPIVPSAILFDLAVGKPSWPDAAAGYRAAVRASGGRVEQGSVGAGAGATVAKMGGPERTWKGGVGTASERLDTGVVVAAITAVNAVGSIRDPRTGEVVAAPRDDEGGMMDVDAILRTGRGRRRTEEAGQNTTLAVVATNARLTKTQVNRLATVAHDGFARTIWPVHTRGDGDVIFALATGEVEITDDQLNAIEAMGTRAVERAVLAGVRLATSLAGVPAVGDRPQNLRRGRRRTR